MTIDTKQDVEKNELSLFAKKVAIVMLAIIVLILVVTLIFAIVFVLFFMPYSFGPP